MTEAKIRDLSYYDTKTFALYKRESPGDVHFVVRVRKKKLVLKYRVRSKEVAEKCVDAAADKFEEDISVNSSFFSVSVKTSGFNVDESTVGTTKLAEKVGRSAVWACLSASDRIDDVDSISRMGGLRVVELVLKPEAALQVGTSKLDCALTVWFVEDKPWLAEFSFDGVFSNEKELCDARSILAKLHLAIGPDESQTGKTARTYERA
jgi:hypothetical protein